MSIIIEKEFGNTNTQTMNIRNKFNLKYETGIIIIQDCNFDKHILTLPEM